MDPVDRSGSAVIDGPSELEIACRGSVVGTYNANRSSATTTITEFVWYRNGERLGGGVEEDITFSREGASSVDVEILDSEGLLDRASYAVQISAPAPGTCPGVIRGDPGHIWDGDTSSEYRLEMPGVSQTRWDLLRDGDVLAVLDDDVGSVSVSFPGPGEYVLRATGSAGGNEFSVEYSVGVLDMEPLAPPGRIGTWTFVTNGPSKPCNREECYGDWRFIDAETGRITEPYFSISDRIDFNSACTEEHIITPWSPNFNLNERTNLARLDIFTGEVLEVLTDEKGLEHDPDVYRDVVVFVNDGRTDYVHDELSMYRNGIASYLSPAIDPFLAGFNPKFDPRGKRIALGVSGVLVDGRQRERIKIVDRATLQWTPLHVGTDEQLYGETPFGVIEGNDLDWHPFADTLVFSATGWGNGAESRLYKSAVGGGSPVFVADDVGGSIFYSPDGRNVFFSRPYNDGLSIDMMVVRLSDGLVRTVTKNTESIGYCGPDEY